MDIKPLDNSRSKCVDNSIENCVQFGQTRKKSFSIDFRHQIYATRAKQTML